MPIPTESDRLHAIQEGTDILQSVSATRVTIDWQRSMPWWFFASGFVRLGWRLSHVVFASIGVWLSLVGWRFAYKVVADADQVPDYPNISDAASISGVGVIRDLVTTSWKFDLPALATMAVLFVWLVLVWGFFGGVICRRSVVELGARTTIGWSGAIKLVVSRLRAIFESVGLPALAAAALLLIPFVLGLIARLGNVGEVFASIGVLLSFLIAIPIGWLVILVIFGFPLMIAAIVTEKDSDAFDGLSRAAAYLFQRPVTILLACVVTFAIASCLSWIVAIAFSTSASFYFDSYASGADITNLQQLDTVFAKKIWSFVGTVLGIVVCGLMASLFWSAVAGTYLVVRREVDHTEYDELDLQEFGSPLALPPVDYGRDGILEIGPVASESKDEKSEPSPAPSNESAN
jgi:hypothetical protein